MKPAIPKGTRDFDPNQVIKREYIFGLIRSVFQRYGYLPIETPALELLSTLTGKYGDEGDKLLFKVLNNGDFLAKADEDALRSNDSARLTPSIAKRGLRYDLTVPFARFVVMHQNDISFPFKRYQIQPVWRADRPQKGRYQEFYQCDADVVGSPSLVYEAELMQIFDQVFTALNLKVTIRINNRKILAGIAEVAGAKDRFMTMTVIFDKLDKIGLDGVRTQLIQAEFSESQVEKMLSFLTVSSLRELKPLMANSKEGILGITELEEVFQLLESIPTNNSLVFDITLARGLSYYTGCIFEVVSDEMQMGSIASGGRYDDLTSIFGLKHVSGVGISFGAERIYDVMEGLERFPVEQTQSPLKVLVLPLDQEGILFSFKAIQGWRSQGISCDMYPEAAKMKKQMKYANSIGVPYVVIIGEEERKSGLVSLKNMQTGDQQTLPIEEVAQKLQ